MGGKVSNTFLIFIDRNDAPISGTYGTIEDGEDKTNSFYRIDVSVILLKPTKKRIFQSVLSKLLQKASHHTINSENG